MAKKKTPVVRTRRNNEEETAADQRIKGARILVVEDIDINREIVRETLEAAGAEVAIACDGREAVQAVSEADFDAVLMDVQMPEMDGCAATRVIRADGRHQDLPIIAITAHAMTGDRAKCLEAGMNDYVTKPIDVQKLLSTIAVYLEPGAEPGAVHEQKRAPADKMAGTLVQTATEMTDKGRSQSLKRTPLGVDRPIEIESGLARVGGNEALYLDLLKRFVEEQATTATDIGHALQRNNHQLAERLAHTIKGVSGNIGAITLHKTAERLEAAIRSKDLQASRSLLQAFSTHLGQVCDAVAIIKPHSASARK